ncbi:MAG: hypothetical protein E6J78_19985 [Deltaproteobacteria bacterium]|nr:MAG: hypothetical protein E6J78_19985 [Deltaproteobacteria bacterium]
MRQLAVAIVVAALTACGGSRAAGGSGDTGRSNPASDGGSGSADGGGDTGTVGPPPTYSLTDLGRATPNFIDGRGRISGIVYSDCGSDAGLCGGAAYTPGSGWSLAPVPQGARYVEVIATDSHGNLALNARYPGPYRSTHPQAFLAPPLQPIPVSSANAQDLSQGSEILAMNGAGHIVGSFYNGTSSGSYLYDGAVTLINAAAPKDLSPFPSKALAINSRDQVVGWVNKLDDSYWVEHAFLWERGVLKDLGTVGGAGTEATAINDSGVVAGWGGTSPYSGVSIIFRWDGEMHRLGCPPGTIHCEAYGINNRGDIVGEALIGVGQGSFAFIHRDGTFFRLDDLVQDAPGWRLDFAAFSINDSGQIVGLGSLNGASRGFLLIPR